LSKALIQWLKSVYQEEIMLQESLENMRLRKLLRAVQIGEESHLKEEVIVQRVFREWKRQGYEMVLEGLKHYSQTLSKEKRYTTPSNASLKSSGHTLRNKYQPPAPFRVSNTSRSPVNKTNTPRHA
jgi:predicted deacetylase